MTKITWPHFGSILRAILKFFNFRLIYFQLKDLENYKIEKEIFSENAFVEPY